MIDEHLDGSTSLDFDEKEGIKLPHITTRDELNEVEQLNITKAARWAVSAKPKKIHDETFLKRLHKKMFGDVWKWAGQFRKTNKNIGCEYWQVSLQLRELCLDIDTWLQHQTYSKPEIAVRFHHRLVKVHPFPNGNGRHARMATNLMMTKQFKLPAFDWGANMLSKQTDVRRQYIAALRDADRQDGSYDKLITLLL